MQEVYQRLQQETCLRVGIIDADLVDHGTRHPNLALLKISSFCKAQGHVVELLLDYDGLEEFDVVFLSCVFSFTEVDQAVLNMPNVHFGGTGLFPDGGEDLPYEVEHSCPDYSLYEPYVKRELALGRRRSVLSDYLDYSIGFTTRMSLNLPGLRRSTIQRWQVIKRQLSSKKRSSSVPAPSRS